MKINCIICGRYLSKTELANRQFESKRFNLEEPVYTCDDCRFVDPEPEQRSEPDDKQASN